MTKMTNSKAKTMMAAFFSRRASPSDAVPSYGEVPRPEPREGEVLVRVHATSIMPTELGWRTTWETQAGVARPFPIIMGHEFSGVVAEMGPGVDGLDVGDEVYGMNDWDRQGAQAEYCITHPDQIASHPTSIGNVKAAGTPISALTAWQALVEHGQISAGLRVLIHGGSGSVGAFAVQIAHALGAYVLTTASTDNLDLARSLGADEVIDYSTTRFEEAARDVDLVLDTIGGDTQERSWSVLKAGGLLISLVHPISAESAAAHRARGSFFVVEPNREQLGEVAQLIDSGTLQPLIASEFPLSEAREAYAYATAGHHSGKTILRIAD